MRSFVNYPKKSSCKSLFAGTKMKFKFSSFYATLCCMALGLVISTMTMAQGTLPADCKTTCRSNDVQITGAYLSDANGVALTSFVCGVDQAYLSLVLSTNAPRVGVAIYSLINSYDPQTGQAGGPLGFVSQCFGVELKGSNNIVTFTSPLTWNCDGPIALTQTSTAWGTGNTNFCTGSGYQCPGAPSKCNSLQAGQLIVVQIPTPGESPAPEKCSEVAGQFLAHFDLTDYEEALADGQNVVITWWRNYDGTDFSDELTGSNKTNFEADANSVTVHAKICNANNLSACSHAAVELTVHEKPGLPAFTITQPTLCGDGTGSLNLCTTVEGFSYKIVDVTTEAVAGDGNSYSFSGLVAGSNPVLKVINTAIAGCNNTFTCSQSVEVCPEPEANNRIMAKPTQLNAVESKIKVKAYPNPFSNRINFVIDAPVSGQGSLEVFNSLGQKVKTVYQGSISKGTQNFELTLPSRQVSNLIYIFRVGDQQVSGKLLQLNH